MSTFCVKWAFWKSLKSAALIFAFTDSLAFCNSSASFLLSFRVTGAKFLTFAIFAGLISSFLTSFFSNIFPIFSLSALFSVASLVSSFFNSACTSFLIWLSASFFISNLLVSKAASSAFVKLGAITPTDSARAMTEPITNFLLFFILHSLNIICMPPLYIYKVK